MEENNIALALSDGTEVELVETWNIDNDDSYPMVDIYDCETNHLIGSYRGALPDIDDDDFDSSDLIEKVEEVLRNN